MNENMNVTYTRMFDLANATYNTWLNAIMWGTERALELNKTIIAQYEANQIEARKYAQDLAEKARQAALLAQESWRESVKSYSSNISSLRNATETNVNDVNRKLDELQHQFVATAAQAN